MFRPRLRHIGDFSRLLLRLAVVPLIVQGGGPRIVWCLPRYRLQRHARQCHRADRLVTRFANGPYAAWQHSMDCVAHDIGVAVLCVEPTETRRNASVISGCCARPAEFATEACPGGRRPIMAVAV